MNASIQVDSTELRKALRYIGDDGLKKQLKDANRAAARVVADVAEPDIPVRTGRLKASLRVRGSQRDASVVVGGARVPYARKVRFVRSKRSVFDVLAKARDGSEGRVLSVYERAISELLDKIRRG